MQFAKRPWGYWIAFITKRHFKVKLLRFKRGSQLSRQYHNHRAELWLFLSGTGEFFNGRWRKAYPGQFHLAEKKQIHQYKAKTNTWVLEIQYGDKCVEEDIVRLD